MASEMAERFMRTLQEIEQSGDPEPLVALFSEDAELWKLNDESEQGREGAREFWQRYLNDFERIASSFHHVIEGEQGIVLEWTSEGALPGGRPIEYDGVSILETDGEQVRRFRTYYDSAAFLSKGGDAGA